MLLQRCVTKESGDETSRGYDQTENRALVELGGNIMQSSLVTPRAPSAGCTGSPRVRMRMRMAMPPTRR